MYFQDAEKFSVESRVAGVVMTAVLCFWGEKKAPFPV